MPDKAKKPGQTIRQDDQHRADRVDDRRDQREERQDQREVERDERHEERRHDDDEVEPDPVPPAISES